MPFFNMIARLRCRVFGHPGVYRQWEWTAMRPEWRERSDAWTCVHCMADIVDVERSMPRYHMKRPVMDPDMIDILNHAIEKYGVENVRLRSAVESVTQLILQ